MKITKIMLAATLAMFGLTGCSMNNSAIIKVNGESITKAQYEEAYKVETNNPQYKLFENAMKDNDSPMPLMLKDRIVNELIVKTLLGQEVAKRNIAVSDEEVKAKRAEIAEKAGGEENLKQILTNNQVDENKFIEDITNELKMEKLVDAIAKVDITDKDVKEFYNENKAQFNYPERVRASHILIQVNPAQVKQDIISSDTKGELTSDAINKKTEEALSEKLKLAKEVRVKAAKNPKEFASLAKQYSDDKATAANGGDLGFFPKEAMVPEFSKAAFSLKPNVVSDVVTTDYGYHIILVTDKAKAGIQPFENVKDEIRAYLEQQKKVDAVKNLLDGLRASAKIEYINADYDLNKIQTEIKAKSELQQKKMAEERAKKQDEKQDKPTEQTSDTQEKTK